MKLTNFILAAVGFIATAAAQVSIVDTVTGSTDHTILEDIVTATEYQAVLDALTAATAGEPRTLFAPTNAAFTAFFTQQGVTETEVTTNPTAAVVALVTDVLKYHLLTDGGFDASALVAAGFKTTAQGLPVFAQAAVPQINGVATVTEIAATNGFVHSIDVVLDPPNTVAKVVIASTLHNTLQAVVTDDDYEGILDAVTASGQKTLFAPTDAAFTTLLGSLGIGASDVITSPTAGNKILFTETLQYHLIATGSFDATQLATAGAKDTALGTSVFAKSAAPQINNQATVVVSIPVSDGIVHVVDTVLSIPGAIPTAVVNEATTAVLESIVVDSAFKVVLDKLGEAGPFTLFAPNDVAFGKAGIDLAFAKANVDAVIKVLLYHVVANKIVAAATPDGSYEFNTLADKSLTVSKTGASVKVNGAAVTEGDLNAKNGIVHVIDTVLTPDTLAPTAAPQADSSASLPVVSTLTALCASAVAYFMN